MFSNNVIFTALSILLPLGVSLLIATYVHHINERKKQKIALLGELMAFRHGLTGNAGQTDAAAKFMCELNKVFAVFHDSKEVMSALMNFHIDKVHTSDNLNNLLIAICKNLKIDTSAIPLGFFECPFVYNVPQVRDSNY